jgi:rare lipoprotein A
MRRGGAGLAVAVALALEACALLKPATPPVVGGSQEGIASWYGPGFHGRRTANGEVYDQYELTAAHQTLPLGTRVMVTSLANGRSVEVRVNDRGPFVGGRVIDLSYAAARVLGMIGPGTMPVRVEVLDAPVRVATRAALPPGRPVPASAARTPPSSPARALVPRPPADRDAPLAPDRRGSYAVLVATLSDPGRAEHLRSRIAIKFAEAHVSPLDAGVGRFYRVRLGPYPSREVALARAALVNRYGYPAVITDEAGR